MYQPSRYDPAVFEVPKPVFVQLRSKVYQHQGLFPRLRNNSSWSDTDTNLSAKTKDLSLHEQFALSTLLAIAGVRKINLERDSVTVYIDGDCDWDQVDASVQRIIPRQPTYIRNVYG